MFFYFLDSVKNGTSKLMDINLSDKVTFVFSTRSADNLDGNNNYTIDNNFIIIIYYYSLINLCYYLLFSFFLSLL